MSGAPRAVYDCNVLLQAVLSKRGPAFACMEMIEKGRVALVVSDDVLAEIRDVLSRPVIRSANPQITPERVALLLEMLARKTDHIRDVPAVFRLPRDPKDEPYLNLAIAAKARYLVSWNERHLGYLMKGDSPEGLEFLGRYPRLRVVTPPVFLRELTHVGLGDMPTV